MCKRHTPPSGRGMPIDIIKTLKTKETKWSRTLKVNDDHFPEVIHVTTNGTNIFIYSNTHVYEYDTNNHVLQQLESYGCPKVTLSQIKNKDIFFGRCAKGEPM